MVIVGIDPSLTCTGYAALVGRDIVGAGRIRPAGQRGGCALGPDDRAWDIAQQAGQACRDLAAQAGEAVCVVVEIPAGQSPARGRRGQAIYGYAVGVLVGYLRARSSDLGLARVDTVPADVWTRGLPKRARAETVQAAHPEIDWAADRGHDVADAVGLVEWWQVEGAISGSE